MKNFGLKTGILGYRTFSSVQVFKARSFLSPISLKAVSFLPVPRVCECVCVCVCIMCVRCVCVCWLSLAMLGTWSGLVLFKV